MTGTLPSTVAMALSTTGRFHLGHPVGFTHHAGQRDAARSDATHKSIKVGIEGRSVFQSSSRGVTAIVTRPDVGVESIKGSVPLGVRIPKG